MGSIERWRNGRWRAHWRDDEGRGQSKVFDYKADAIAFIDRAEAALERGSYLSPTQRRLTVAGFVTEHWLPAQSWRPSTREAFDSHWRCHIGPRWGDAPLAGIRKTACQAWVNELAEKLAPATVEALHRRFVSIVLAAVDDGIIDRAPTTGVKLPKDERRRTSRVAVPTPDEVTAIADAVPAHYADLVWLIATCGLRPGEAVAVTVDRVNFLKREIVVDRQLRTQIGAGVVFGPPKTRAGDRIVPAPPELLERLAAHIERFGTIGASDGTRLIFSTLWRSPIRRNLLSDSWQRAARNIGLRGELRGWHSLRHYAITRLIAAGVNPDYVREFAGHESLRETLEVYTGWWPSDADDARDALAQALAAAGE